MLESVSATNALQNQVIYVTHYLVAILEHNGNAEIKVIFHFVSIVIYNIM